MIFPIIVALGSVLAVLAWLAFWALKGDLRVFPPITNAPPTSWVSLDEVSGPIGLREYTCNSGTQDEPGDAWTRRVPIYADGALFRIETELWSEKALAEESEVTFSFIRLLQSADENAALSGCSAVARPLRSVSPAASPGTAPPSGSPREEPVAAVLNPQAAASPLKFKIRQLGPQHWSGSLVFGLRAPEGGPSIWRVEASVEFGYACRSCDGFIDRESLEVSWR
ncbi:hypothetical protein AB0J82_39105 [Asanoa sp. NPDC049518]|uniref:hypothetical protein n=1 Tax=unclassified Asanoa TaxID=2685164 RepID=UPI003416FC23